jgi:hypothetical protein
MITNDAVMLYTLFNVSLFYKKHAICTDSFIKNLLKNIKFSNEKTQMRRDWHWLLRKIPR